MNILTMAEIKEVLHTLLTRYNAEYAIVFGSYARGDATPDSDLDVIIVGGKNFVPRNIFALAEDLRELIGRNADVFEIPWSMVSGLRHRLVHDYDGINWSFIVDVIFDDMDPFVQEIQKILQNIA